MSKGMSFPSWSNGIHAKSTEMCRFRIVRSLDVGLRRTQWAMGMGVVNGNEFFSLCPQFPQGFDQLCRIHLKLGGALSNIRHRYESGSRNQTTAFVRVSRLGMFNDFLEDSGFEREVHETLRCRVLQLRSLLVRH